MEHPDMVNALKQLKKDWMTVAEAAARLGVSNSRIRQLTMQGRVEKLVWSTNYTYVKRKDIEQIFKDPNRSKTGPKKSA